MAAVNKAPPYPKQKYNDSKFREIIPLLPLNEYLKIEYLAKGVWFKMLSKRLNSYNCECCGVDNVGPTPITDHVRGKKHRFALQTAERLYHPNYTTPKNSNTPGRTPILDAYNGAAGGNLPAKQTKVTPTSKPEAQSTKSVVQQKATIQQKPQPKTAAHANKKPNEPVKTPVAHKTSVTAAKTAVKPQEQIQPKEAVSKPQEMPKPAENIKKNEDVKESEIVVLIDDDDDVPVKNDPAPKAEATGNTPVVSTPETAKPQRAQKRNANTVRAPESVDKPSSAEQVSDQDNKPPGKDGNEGNSTITTPTQKVINPAAVLAKSAEKSSDNVPRYQQNRVIIPTVDKTKKKSSPVVSKQPVVAAAPTFSTKKFSMSNEIEGIIGVEYVVKILKVYNDPEPFYECCLCEVVMDGVGMQTHLLGYNHRYKYIEKHFPTCFSQYKDHIGNIQVMGIILDRVARAIEDHHGRELPYECLSGEFRSNRHGVMTTVYSFRHASEYSGPSFTNVVDNKQIDEMYKKKQMYHPPKPDPKRKPTFDTRSGAPETKRSKVDRRGNGVPNNSRGANGSSSRRPYRDEIETNVIDDAVHKQMVEEFLQNTRGRSRSPAGGRRRRHRSRTRSRSPHRSSRRERERAAARRSLSPLREGDVWQAYRHLVDRSKTELEQLYAEYRKDPEKHPLYDEEWRKFWKHRKEQISREGLDHRNYDFQPEWVRYFAVRIEELYDEAVEDIKVSSRRRLILPMTNDELEDKRYHVKAPIEEEPVEIVKPMLQYPQVVDNKPSVVSVLRLLTALEDYLGSLGPRVVDLLSKALLVEKTHPREINEIVLTLENCTVLETAMEKLKGVLIAGLLEGPKVRAFNNVIMETEKILKFAYKIRQRNPQPVPQPVPAPKSHQELQKSTWTQGGGSFMPSPQLNSMPTTAVTSGAAASLLSQIDKKELASKLAAALTAQGKTDFNPEQLQQLIAVYSLIDKKKRDSAAAVDKHKMTLSDTLTALLAPTEKSSDVGTGAMPSSGRGNYSNSNIDRMGDRPGPLSNSSINSFVSMLNRDGNSTGGNSADSQMWQNLQNIQNSLRTQNTMGASSNTGGYGSGSMGRIGGGGGTGGGSGYMSNTDNLSAGGNFNRGGFGGGSSIGGGATGGGFSLAQNSSLNFNRSAPSGGDSSGGYGSNFQSMSGNNSSGFPRGGGGDDMLGGGRGDGRGMGGNFSSGGIGGGINSLSRGGGGSGGVGGGGNMGGGNNIGFSRGGGDNFLGGSRSNNTGGSNGGFGGNLSSGLNYPTGSGGGNNNYQRGSGGMGGGSNSSLGLGLGMGIGSGGCNFPRSGGGGSGGNSMSNTFNNLMSNKNTARNDGSGSSFASNQRNIGGNDEGGSSFGSSQRNMGGNDGGSLGFGSNQRNFSGNQPNRGGGGNMLMGSNSISSQGQGGNRGGGSNWRNQ